MYCAKMTESAAAAPGLTHRIIAQQNKKAIKARYESDSINRDMKYIQVLQMRHPDKLAHHLIWATLFLVQYSNFEMCIMMN